MLTYDMVTVLIWPAWRGAEFNLVKTIVVFCRCVARRAEQGFHRASSSHTALSAARWPAQRGGPLSTSQVHRQYAPAALMRDGWQDAPVFSQA